MFYLCLISDRKLNANMFVFVEYETPAQMLWHWNSNSIFDSKFSFLNMNNILFKITITAAWYNNNNIVNEESQKNCLDVSQTKNDYFKIN